MSRELECSPVPTSAPVTGAETLSAWWDDEGFRSITLSMRGSDPDHALGSSTATPAASAEVEFEPEERVTQIVFTSQESEWGPVLRRITIETDQPRTIELGPEPAAEAGHSEERFKVHDAALCGVFGRVDPLSGRIVSAGFQLRGPHVRQEILDHLNDNELHYSRAVWANADELALTGILANFEYDDGVSGEPVPLAARLDPTPVATTGNYLGFRWHFVDEATRQQVARGPRPRRGRRRRRIVVDHHDRLDPDRRRLRRSGARSFERRREAGHHAVLGLADLADPDPADGDRTDRHGESCT